MNNNLKLLFSTVIEMLEVEADEKEYNIRIREQMGLSPDAVLWIRDLDPSVAHRLGVLKERCTQVAWRLDIMCAMERIDKDSLISAVKSMQRKEKHNGKWDNPCLTEWIGYNDQQSIYNFLEK